MHARCAHEQDGAVPDPRGEGQHHQGLRGEADGDDLRHRVMLGQPFGQGVEAGAERDRQQHQADAEQGP